MIKSYFKQLLTKNHNKSHSSLNLPFMTYHDDDNVGVASYKNNSVVHRCVSLIATSASHVPWQLYKNLGHSNRFLSKHPAIQLLKKPNAERSGADFFADNIANLLLYGNSYMLSTSGKNLPPCEIYNLQPSMVEHVMSHKLLTVLSHV